MRNETLGQHKSINDFVAAKLRRLDELGASFDALFEVMFSERENILYETSRGYRIEKLTYGQAYDDILRRARTLAGLLDDTPRGSVVGLHMSNGPDWIELFWAILACGMRPFLMNTRMDDETLAAALAACGAAAVVSDGRSFAVRTIPAGEILPADEPIERGPFGGELLVMSSGTSLHVKLCAYTAAELRSQIGDSSDIIRRCAQMKKHYKGQLKQLDFLPFYHVFGLIAVYIWFGFFSRSFVHLADMSPQTILNTIRRHSVTHIFAVPLFWDTVYAQALAAIRDRGEETWARFQKGMRIARAVGDVPLLGRLFGRVAFREVRDGLFGESICFMIAGGSEIRGDVLEFFNAIGYHLADGYGMTEIGITSVELSRRKKLLDSASVGLPMDSMEYRLSDEGELLVRGPSAARYVLCDGTRTENTGDWFHTGDLASFEGGRWRILGRRDDLVISPSGENLNPSLIEQRIDVPGADQVCLVSVRENDAATPVLLVSVSPRLTAEALAGVRSALRDRLAALGLAGQIGRIVLVEGDLMGEQDFKLNRTRLARDYAAGRLKEAVGRAPMDASAQDELTRRVLAYMELALDREEGTLLPDDDFFLDGGGTSLAYFALIAQLQEEFGITFPTSGGRSLSTARELAAYIRAA